MRTPNERINMSRVSLFNSLWLITSKSNTSDMRGPLEPCFANQVRKLSRKLSTSAWENIASCIAVVSRSNTLVSSRLNWIRKSCASTQKLTPSPLTPTSRTPTARAVSRAFSMSIIKEFRSSAVASGGRPIFSKNGPTSFGSKEPLWFASQSENTNRKESSSVLLNPAQRRCSRSFTLRWSSTHWRNPSKERASPASSRRRVASACKERRRPQTFARIFARFTVSPE
mmetsp:Transcript_34957/g.78343  ORF Transcript_34957/g.78343 Transcript_34957/m.78343 type:complete len:227 (+) Transcript_34957:233-913(+)